MTSNQARNRIRTTLGMRACRVRLVHMRNTFLLASNVYICAYASYYSLHPLPHPPGRVPPSLSNHFTECPPLRPINPYQGFETPTIFCTASLVISAGVRLISTATTPSSPSGSSRVASCESSICDTIRSGRSWYISSASYDRLGPSRKGVQRKKGESEDKQTDLGAHEMSFALSYPVLQKLSSTFAVHKVGVHSGRFRGHDLLLEGKRDVTCKLAWSDSFLCMQKAQ
jgi:hypothetical protein